MDADEVTKQVDEKFGDFNVLFDRMDKDFERWDLITTQVADYDSTTKQRTGAHETDIIITSNRLRTFADEVHSKLASAEMAISVRMAENEGEDKRGDMGKLERLLYFAFEKADERLVRILQVPLREQIIWGASIRGWVAGRFPVYKSDGKVVFDFMPWDRRWVVYEVGSNGFLWAAHKTFRSKASLEDEYGYKDSPNEKDNEVIDHWRQEGKKIINVIISDKQELHKETLEIPSMPVLVMPVATRPMIISNLGNELSSYGESIFAPIRESNRLLNQVASIVVTHANLLAKQPIINYLDDEGKVLENTIYFAEAVLNLPMGHNELVPAPMKEIAPTIVGVLDWLEQQVERGSLPHVSVGTPPQSGTLENLVQEARNIVFNPQLRLLNIFYSGICRLIEEQLIAGDIKVDVQTELKNKYYETEVTPVDLKKSHKIKVTFTATTPWSQMDTAQVALMLKQLGLPDGWIWENILKVQDPKGLADLAAIELFEHSPKGAMKRAVEALVETRGDIAAAQSLIRDMDRMETQEDGAETPQAPPLPPLEE